METPAQRLDRLRNAIEPGRRIALVGAGANARQHALGLAQGEPAVRLAALVEPDEQRAASFAQGFGGVRTYADVEAMLAADEAIDAAIVSTPTPVRDSVCRPLIDAGVPLLVEKPLCDRLADAVDLVDRAQAAGVPLAVNQNFRYHFPFDAAARWLADPAHGAGRIRHIAQTVRWFREVAGWRAASPRRVMSIMSVHWLDGYRLLLGDPVSVTSLAIGEDGVSGGIDHAVSVLLRWDDGAVASLSESFISHRGQSWSDIRCSIDAENASLELHAEGTIEVHRRGALVAQLTGQALTKPRSNLLVLLTMLDAAERGEPAPTAGRDNLRTLAMLEAAYASAESHAPETLPAAIAGAGRLDGGGVRIAMAQTRKESA